MGIYDLLALALELLPEVVRQSAGSLPMVVGPRQLAVFLWLPCVMWPWDVSRQGNTHSMFFVVVIFLDLPHFWSPLGVPRMSLGGLRFEASWPSAFCLSGPYNTCCPCLRCYAFGLLGCR